MSTREQVTIVGPGVPVVFHEFRPGQWAATLWPGWTAFGDSPEEAFAALLAKHRKDFDAAMERRR